LLRYIKAERKVPIDLVVRGRAGQALTVVARDTFGRVASAESDAVLETAASSPLSPELLRDKLGSFGETRYALRHLDVQLEGAVATSPAVLKRLRRALVAALESQPRVAASHAVHDIDMPSLVPQVAERALPGKPELVPLCRTLEQVDAALAFGAREIYVDFME